MDDIARLLAEQQLGEESAFKALFRDPSFIATLDLPGPPPTLEGYLFPDTYEFRVGVAPREVTSRMTARFREVFGQDLAEAARSRGMSVHQALTLASIVEKEAAVAGERPTIAAVFHNRLKRGMPLQSDPTAIYGLEVRPTSTATRPTTPTRSRACRRGRSPTPAGPRSRLPCIPPRV